MKSVLVILFCTLSFVMTSFSNNRYIVNANKLKVHDSPALSSKVVGIISKGDTVNVLGFESNWAKIEFKNNPCYVHTDYIQIIQETAIKKSDKKSDFRNKLLINTDSNMIYIYGVMILSLISFIYRLFWRKKNLVIFPGILLVSICLLEIYYFLILKGDTYFCSWNHVGFVYMIINFILFSLVIINQILCFYHIFLSFQRKGVYVKYAVFLVGSAITLIGIFAKIIFWKSPSAEKTIIIFYCSTVAIQALMILQSSNYTNYFILHTFVFTVFAIGTMVVLYNFIPLLIVALIGAIVFRSILGGLSEGAGNSSSDYNYHHNEYNHSSQAEEIKYTVKDENGEERKLEDTGFGSFRDDQGNYWEKNTWGTEVRRKE
ncbi:MAG TPA: SH3 domain-containing protein [Draconibacterium sp.]|nr:SH3 domain-containing protein [Draconibacterium sp.]